MLRPPKVVVKTGSFYFLMSNDNNKVVNYLEKFIEYCNDVNLNLEVL